MSNLPVGWCQATVGDVTEPYSSIDPRKTPQKLFRYVDIGAIDNQSLAIASPKTFTGADAPSRARRVIRVGDTLFSTVRTYLKNIALVPPELDGELTSTGVAVLRPNEAIVPGYLFTWIRSDEFVSQISSSQDGTMYPAVNDADVMCAPITVPPIGEQRRIVSKIDSLSAKSKRARDRLDHVPRLVEKYKQAILAAAFNGRLTGTASAPIADVALGNLLASGPQNGLYLPKSQYGSGTPILRIQSYGLGDATDVSSWHKVRLSDDMRSQYALVAGDLIINRVNSPSHLGKSVVITESMVGSVFESNMMRMRLAPTALPKYVQLYLSSDIGRGKLTSGAKWAVNQASINQSDVKATLVPMVDIQEQRKVLESIERAFTWIDRLASEGTGARKLINQLDQAILAKAFRGELVPQDPRDEPSSILLGRIQTERASSVRQTVRRSARTTS